MDIHAYIQSGIIESYLLGIAGEDERQELDKLRRQYPEVENAIHSAEDWLYGVATPHSNPVPTGIRQRVFDSIHDEFRKSPAPLEIRISNPAYKYVAAATFILLVSSVAINLVLYKKYQAEKGNVLALQEKQQTLIVNNDIIQAKMQSMNADLKSISSPELAKINMQAVPGKGIFQSTLFIDSKRGQIFLVSNTLPTVPAGKQYQLWAIVNGKPVNAGLLDQCDTYCKFNAVANAEAYAVTLEQKGGSTDPTLDQMYVVGKVNG